MTTSPQNIFLIALAILFFFLYVRRYVQGLYIGMKEVRIQLFINLMTMFLIGVIIFITNLSTIR